MSGNLVSGGTKDPFLPELLSAIRKADEIDLAVAFIKSSGLELVFGALSDAVTIRKARLRVLTSDYLDVTDPQALRRLMLLADCGADTRVYNAGHQHSFHLKAYICVKTRSGSEVWGAAFVGSSNISRTALTEGVEWNYRVELGDATAASASRAFGEIRAKYQALFDDEKVVALDHQWIEAYESRRKEPRPETEEPEPSPPQPTRVQQEALQALATTRDSGYRRGLVVMATGLGKTYLAAFDCERTEAKRVLFVAHREEILLQAEVSFQRVRPRARIGRYTGTQKDTDVDLLFASVQTLGKSRHLEKFEPGRFDYIVVDEFHHAAAPTYRRLLHYFRPGFLVGLTATPQRTDQSDILSLCDDNLVYAKHLFDGIELGLLCPFHYYGIYDETVDYREIPWRSGRFDPEMLSNKLATLGRARHALQQWGEKAQARTLAFCVSIRHADFMAERFRKEGIRAAAIHGRSDLDRGAALEQLESGDIQVIFSVDLFNEGVDLPAIDTVMMLRPTESKVLFLQQLGRGLRRHTGKDYLVVLDFIGNHKGFFNKPQALFGVGTDSRALIDFARRIRDDRLELPAGCYANYDLEVIDFLTRLKGRGPAADYQALRTSLGHRPTLAEFYRSGANLTDLHRQHDHWWALVHDQKDLDGAEVACLQRHGAFFREVETTAMTKSFKAILLDSLLDNDGFRRPLRLTDLAAQAQEVFRRRPEFINDIKKELRDFENVEPGKWLAYWNNNPVAAWTGKNRGKDTQRWFEVSDDRFRPIFELEENESDAFMPMVQELVDYRLAAYGDRAKRHHSTQGVKHSADIVPFPDQGSEGQESTELPYFPDLRIACGHFRSGRTDVDEMFPVGPGHGRLNPSRHFVARAIGDSMNGGKQPVHDGDLLLLELVEPAQAGAITGKVMVVERQDAGGDDQYLLRLVTKTPEGRYVLKATNPEYPDYDTDEGMRTLARLKAVLEE